MHLSTEGNRSSDDRPFASTSSELAVIGQALAFSDTTLPNRRRPHHGSRAADFPAVMPLGTVAPALPHFVENSSSVFSGLNRSHRQ
jgi:hypothetical protein